jgi:hypothetical protein
VLRKRVVSRDMGSLGGRLRDGCVCRKPEAAASFREGIRKYQICVHLDRLSRNVGDESCAHDRLHLLHLCYPK